ncbi:hypothetical protein E2C01_015138 [Portunus trituberculatus]|uniref:Uncharacterized protein n=1 Tax=Portunus trituberculatus TaxID=210409 RepID=A0A5B7DKJ0_PORTR|nr:hypothetical protein [Portunus trituberculatus]
MSLAQLRWRDAHSTLLAAVILSVNTRGSSWCSGLGDGTVLKPGFHHRGLAVRATTTCGQRCGRAQKCLHAVTSGISQAASRYQPLTETVLVVVYNSKEVSWQSTTRRMHVTSLIQGLKYMEFEDITDSGSGQAITLPEPASDQPALSYNTPAPHLPWNDTTTPTTTNRRIKGAHHSGNDKERMCHLSLSPETGHRNHNREHWVNRFLLHPATCKKREGCEGRSGSLQGQFSAPCEQ